MKNTAKAFLALIAAAGLAGIAMAQTSHQGGHGSHGSGHGQSGGAPARMDPAAMQTMMQGMMPSPSDPEPVRDYKSADMSMMHAMNVPYSGNPDVDFRRKMIPHHQGAIDMAKVALKHAKDPETKKMAQKIIDDQEEITEMQEWLKKNNK